MDKSKKRKPGRGGIRQNAGSKPTFEGSTVNRSYIVRHEVDVWLQWLKKTGKTKNLSYKLDEVLTADMNKDEEYAAMKKQVEG